MRFGFAWQVRTTLLIGIVGPPVASFIVLALVYLPAVQLQADPIEVARFTIPLVLLTLAVGYTFGAIPALLTGAVYSGALTLVPTLRQLTLLRACLAGVFGGLIGELWFRAVIGVDSSGYGLVAAAVACVLSLRRGWFKSPVAAPAPVRAERSVPAYRAPVGARHRGRPGRHPAR
jgi:hypothetical protein